MMYRQAQTTDTLIIETPPAIDESKVIAINSRTAAIMTGGGFSVFRADGAGLRPMQRCKMSYSMSSLWIANATKKTALFQWSDEISTPAEFRNGGCATLDRLKFLGRAGGINRPINAARV